MFNQLSVTEDSPLRNSRFNQLSENSPLKTCNFNQLSEYTHQTDNVCEMFRKMSVEEEENNNLMDQRTQYTPQEKLFSVSCFDSPCTYTEDSMTAYSKDLNLTSNCDKLETGSYYEDYEKSIYD